MNNNSKFSANWFENVVLYYLQMKKTTNTKDGWDFFYQNYLKKKKREDIYIITTEWPFSHA